MTPDALVRAYQGRPISTLPLRIAAVGDPPVLTAEDLAAIQQKSDQLSKAFDERTRAMWRVGPPDRSRQSRDSADVARIAELEQQLTAIRMCPPLYHDYGDVQRIAELEQQVADLPYHDKDDLARIAALESELTAVTEQRDSYRDRSQELACRVTDLEARLSHAAEAWGWLGALDDRLRVGDVVDQSDVDLLQQHLAELRAANEFNGRKPTPDRRVDLTSALRALVARVRRCGGHAEPHEQEALWEAEWLLAQGGGQ